MIQIRPSRPQLERVAERLIRNIDANTESAIDYLIPDLRAEIVRSLQQEFSVHLADESPPQLEEDLVKFETSLRGLEPESVIDSGYGSTLWYKPCAESVEPSWLSNDPIHNSETKQPAKLDDTTCYTGSTMDGPLIQGYIEEIAEDIFNKLQPEMGEKEWNVISNSAIVFLKVFALKMGHYSHTPTHTKVMKFVHKHCSKIVANIDILFSGEDHSLKNQKDKSENISLSDKMALWAGKSDAESGVVHKCLFEGVSSEELPDDNEDEVNEAEMSIYRGAVANSPPFNWLLFTLRKEMLLATDGLECEPTGENIKEKILLQLPSGVISRRGPPVVHEIPSPTELKFQRVSKVTGLRSQYAAQDIRLPNSVNS
ncbi:hypothetical protein G7Z17_g830 [Cylindrodendrum hubeiense]|uniref:Uncharacterized protein n=1 Tax=Cylindrodendrum hubeiense TaxID=595255 RepID=A0A9P5HKK5_9HYPO|nr:hypothetical protein G7Z17_g830 [Cylindrodendrum hubeiense]